MHKIDIGNMDSHGGLDNQRCAYCLHEFTRDQESIGITCRKSHFFHKNCISNEDRELMNCPL